MELVQHATYKCILPYNTSCGQFKVACVDTNRHFVKRKNCALSKFAANLPKGVLLDFNRFVQLSKYKAK